jgi:hypothetical protein
VICYQVSIGAGEFARVGFERNYHSYSSGVGSTTGTLLKGTNINTVGGGFMQETVVYGSNAVPGYPAPFTYSTTSGIGAGARSSAQPPGVANAAVSGVVVVEFVG